MKPKDIIIILLLLAFAIVTYFLGYQTGARKERMRGDARFLISMHDDVYNLAQAGDFQKIKATMSMVLLGEVRTYQNQFGYETGTNHFAVHFTDAKNLADKFEKQLVHLNP